MNIVNDIRKMFVQKFDNNEFVISDSGVKCVEIQNAAFIADENYIVRKPNEDYIQRESEWYRSMSLNVNDIPGTTPVIWKNVATQDGFINSNYGWCIFSEDNDHQYQSCLNQLVLDKSSRRATMIYNRPEMQTDYNKDGKSDFMCTYAVQYMIRDNKLNAYVIMRSNDAIFGYNNDFAWQEEVLVELFQDLLPVYPELQCGEIYWNAISLHIYERHFDLIEDMRDLIK